ncbi:MAG: pseudouridine synthase [Desulfonatronovibrio sp.]
MPDPIRLNKALARAGICSRRKADELISSGRVLLNGVIVKEMGTMVDADTDRIKVDGRDISRAGSRENDLVYLALNKPVQVVSTVSDPQARKTVMDFLPERFRNRRLFPVGRLDYFSQGLILLTNDGDLTYRLTHPSWDHPKIYQLVVRQKPDPKSLKTMARGMTLSDGRKLAPVKVDIVESRPEHTTLELVLTQGVNRQIRRMCHDLGLTVLRLTRTAHGPIRLGSLKPGECRPLSPKEVQALRESRRG